MRQLVGLSAGLVLWSGAVVVATTAIMDLLGALAAGGLLTLRRVLND